MPSSGEERKGEREKGRKGEREKGRKGEREKGRKGKRNCAANQEPATQVSLTVPSMRGVEPKNPGANRRLFGS
jgi:hypothetical protein